MHIPVLLQESVEILLGSGGRVFLDCTVGLGGHAREILRRNPDSYVIGIDLDEYALEKAQENLKEFEGRFSLYRANFRDMDEVLAEEGIEKVDGILMDLGVSMFQLKSGRGFSFQDNAPLDMRIGRDQNLTAYRVVNEYPQKELVRIFREYGEERFSGRIAKAIVRAREKKPIETTAELVEIITSALPTPRRRGRIHPATRVFQAIRIEVNRELENLQVALEKTPSLLKRGGRLVVISFHSLEDRIVKNFFKDHRSQFRVLTKKPLTPKEEEIERNPASRSAKLRAGERL